MHKHGKNHQYFQRGFWISYFFNKLVMNETKSKNLHFICFLEFKTQYIREKLYLKKTFKIFLNKLEYFESLGATKIEMLQ